MMPSASSSNGQGRPRPHPSRSNSLGHACCLKYQITPSTTFLGMSARQGRVSAARDTLTNHGTELSQWMWHHTSDGDSLLCTIPPSARSSCRKLFRNSHKAVEVMLNSPRVSGLCFEAEVLVSGSVSPPLSLSHTQATATPTPVNGISSLQGAIPRH